MNLLTFEGGLLEVDGMSDGAFLLLLTFVLSCEGCTGLAFVAGLELPFVVGFALEFLVVGASYY